MKLRFYFTVIAAGLVFCCAMPVAADSWTNPVQIQINNDDKLVHNTPAISAAGNKILYSSETRTVAAADDIYFSTLTDTIWSIPVYLDSTVNDTVLQDESPCVGFDDTTLFFARQDTIYRSYFTGGLWQTPEKFLPGGGPCISKDGATFFFRVFSQECGCF